ncbi:MAG: hypothetical protein EBT54_04200 [Betaproteobacteria bacterium]|nr:hypothetical protein [Betaproteobacteria bacterium]
MTVRLALVALLTLTACASNAPARPSLSAQARAHTELAEAYYQNAQYAVALTEVRAALSADSGFAPAHNLDGLLHGHRSAGQRRAQQPRCAALPHRAAGPRCGRVAACHR